MATWVYNNAALNGFAALHPYNGGMTGLATTGNALRVQVNVPDQSVVSIAHPAAGFVSERVTGLTRRLVVWEWQIATTSEANLNTIEAILEAYVADGREYILSDGARSSSFAKLMAIGTGRAGQRRALPGGRYLQPWRLGFAVLRPSVGATSL